MTSDHIVERMNAHQAAVIRTLNGCVQRFDADAQALQMGFDIGLECCHSVDVVQGGYVTAMMDAAMAHAVIAAEVFKAQASSIDINVSFLRPARAGRFTAIGSIVKLGRSVAFLKAELLNAKGELVATATSSAYLQRSAD